MISLFLKWVPPFIVTWHHSSVLEGISRSAFYIRPFKFVNIARTHACMEITHFPMTCIIRAWEAWGHRLSALQVLTIHHQVGKCVIPTWSWVLAFIPWPVRNIKAAMWKPHISTHPFSTYIVSWSWDNSGDLFCSKESQTTRWWMFLSSFATQPTSVIYRVLIVFCSFGLLCIFPSDHSSPGDGCLRPMALFFANKLNFDWIYINQNRLCKEGHFLCLLH